MNLKEYGKNELSLRVLNCEGSYSYMIELIDEGLSAYNITELLAEGYDVTDDQFEEMRDSVRLEIEERRG